MAQEMEVKKFQETMSDLSARTNPRQDLNGDECALIKVQIASADVTFSGSVMGDVKFKGNEYWVYMPAGSKRLKVVHPSYLPLEITFEDYDVPTLKSKNTYVLTLILGGLSQGVSKIDGVSIEFGSSDTLMLRRRIQDALRPAYQKELAKYEKVPYYEMDQERKREFYLACNRFEDVAARDIYRCLASSVAFPQEFFDKEWVQTKQYFRYMLYRQMVRNSSGHGKDYEDEIFHYYEKEDTLKLRKQIQNALRPLYKEHLSKYEKETYFEMGQEQIQRFTEAGIRFKEGCWNVNQLLALDLVGVFSKELYDNEFCQSVMYYELPLLWQMQRNSRGHENDFKGKVFRYYEFDCSD